MEVFVARQPIFDKRQEVFAYELLYRDNQKNFYQSVDGDKASSNVIINSFVLIGMNTLTGGKKAFINFTENLIKEEIATIFPKDSLVLEVLENVVPDDKVIKACKHMKKMGFTLALDDFIFKPEFEPLLEIADIVKIDFLNSSPYERAFIVKKYKGKGIKFLAEKIETQEQFKEAVRLGYEYFQGFFFSKPVILSAKNIAPFKLNCIQLISYINQPEPDFNVIANIVERDLSLSYELLRLINSVAYSRGNKITSIKHALTMLGIEETKKWIALVALSKIGEDKPQEVMVTCMVRAKFCELLATYMGLRDRSSELFMVGLFSMIDVLMNRSLQDILTDLPVSDDIRNALLGGESVFSDIHYIVITYESGNWSTVEELLVRSRLDGSTLADIYCKALKWTRQISE